jgi:hypothetical protein
MSRAQDACAHHGPGASVVDLGYDEIDQQILALLRHYFSSFAAPERQAWVSAIAAALRDFGETRGPEIAVGALSAVQAMRRARRSTFRFNSPGCPNCARHVTDHERLLMTVLRETARDRPEAAAAHATLLCEGNDAGRLTAALETLVRLARPQANASGTRSRRRMKWALFPVGP